MVRLKLTQGLLVVGDTTGFQHLISFPFAVVLKMALFLTCNLVADITCLS